MEQMVMIVPVNADIDKAEHVADKYRQQWPQGSRIISMRHFHFKHHDGNDDRNDSIAECFQSIFSHRNRLGGLFNAKHSCHEDETSRRDSFSSWRMFQYRP